MKRALCLAVILLLAGIVSLTAAGLKVAGQKDNIVIRETTLYGDPQAATGIQVRITSQWKGYLIWNTLYTLGGGPAESSFAFSSLGKVWSKQTADEISIACEPDWGMDIYSDTYQFEPEEHPLGRIVQAVMERTQPGEKHTETVRLKDYYEYYPLEFYLSRGNTDVYYYELEGDMSDFLQIPVDEETVKISLEKNEAGKVTGVDFFDPQGVPPFTNLSAFGQEGCYHAFYYPTYQTNYLDANLKYWDYDRVENSDIYYYPYAEDSGKRNRLTIDPSQARIAYNLSSGISLVEMELNETLGELYLVTREGQGFYLSVFDADGANLDLRQRLLVRSVKGEAGTEGNPYWAQMSVQENGVLMVWQDGSFAFAARQGEQWTMWGLERHPSARYLKELTFPAENVWAFDGERLALASFVDWDSNSLNLAVYTQEGLSWYGVCEHSSDIYRAQSDYELLITPPNIVGFYRIDNSNGNVFSRRGVAVEELLGIEWE